MFPDDTWVQPMSSPIDLRVRGRSHTVLSAFLDEESKRSPDDLLTTAQVSKQYAIAVSTLGNWRWKRQGPPFVRIGSKKIVYRRADVDAWLRQQQRR
jgi:predicted DNA-binding transcriptional regulator AlpA